jgi:hypothetical protein
MGGPRSLRRAPSQIARGLLFLGVLLVACLATMTLSFYLVRHLGGNAATEATPSPAVVDQATRLNGWANELLALTAEYLDLVEAESGSPSEPFRVRLAEDFGPRVNDLRRRMQAASGAPEGLSALLAASDKVAAMAKHPEQDQLRQDAVAAVLDVADAVETRVKSLGLWRDLERRPRSEHFRPETRGNDPNPGSG